MNEYLSLHYTEKYLSNKTNKELKTLYTKKKLIDALKTLGVYKDYMKRLNVDKLQKKYDQAVVESQRPEELDSRPKSNNVNISNAQAICDNIFLSILKEP